MIDDEADIIRRAQAGDERAFEILLKKWSPKIKEIASRMCQSRPWMDKDDLYQVGSADFWNAVMKFDESLGVKVQSYAVTAAKYGMLNECDLIRHRSMAAERNGADTEDGNQVEIPFDEDQSMGIQVDDMRRIVGQQLERLPPRQREAIMLIFYGERTIAQVAEEMGVTRQAVDCLVARSLERLRRSVVLKRHAS